MPLLFCQSFSPFTVEGIMTGVLKAELMPLAVNTLGLLERRGGSCPQALIRDQLILLKS